MQRERIIGMFSLLLHFRVLSFSSSFVRHPMMIHRVVFETVGIYHLNKGVFTPSYHRAAQLD